MDKMESPKKTEKIQESPKKTESSTKTETIQECPKKTENNSEKGITAWTLNYII